MFVKFKKAMGMDTDDVWINPRSVRMVLVETKEGTRITGVGPNGYVVVKGDIQSTLSALQDAMSTSQS